MVDDDALSPARFGAAFFQFLSEINRAIPPPGPVLADRIHAHVGGDAAAFPIFAEAFDSFDHPNLQVALDDYLSEASGRKSTLIGIANDQKQYLQTVLSVIVSGGGMGMPPFVEGPVDYVTFHLADRMLSCVQYGLYLIRDGGQPLVVAVIGPGEMHGRQKIRIEVLATDLEIGQAFVRDIRERMSRLNVYRGHVISLSPGRLDMGAQSLVAFHTLPDVARENVILPEELLARIERHTFVFAEHADTLRAAGRSLKRGMLLYGPPGIGKTLTLMYLVGRMKGRTVLLTTGLGMGLLDPVMQMARTLAPSMVILEDVDLIAEERGMPHSSGGLLFELLNQLDGLADDADLIFALTTNRPELLEPALAARPGRVDLAVELPLPDAAARQKLLRLYGEGLELVDVDLEAFARQTDGASPAYIKELLRRGAVLAAVEAGEADGALRVTAAHLGQAIEELSEGGRLARRILGFQHADDGPAPMMEPGFPGWSPAPWAG